MAGAIEAEGDPDFMTSLARGLAVLRCFAEQQRPMTIAQASRLTGLSRPAVRRCLHTLVRLGYAAQDETNYVLRPKTLALGYAYLSSSSLALKAQPLLDELRDELHESCSLGVIEEDEVYYVARAEVSRIMSVALRVGSRLPLYNTSMGRVLLASLPRAEQEAYLARTELRAVTPHTQTDPASLLAIFSTVRDQGYAIVDEELEPGLRSVAVPVTGRAGLVAALNIGTQAARVPLADLYMRCLPALRRVARDLGSMGL
ncbi:IclR family transcriptional regulator domain-containing protein [Flavisphingomonas formosensis]|uniref:IclR family transcriptional regulator domain-containing protein n=1 Tax=Flavisphingomonas formosensis TaxID=861534 RepID=UPI0012FCCE8B|nr:IclR family transcriptional regulator C-terminal domain-containing protein [Sphingomonas formosensis]